MDYLLFTIFQTKAAWVLGVVILLAMAISILFYIQIVFSLLGSAVIPMVKNLVGKCSLRKTARFAGERPWHRADLGVTMPDGGEPVEAEKEVKES